MRSVVRKITPGDGAISAREANGALRLQICGGTPQELAALTEHLLAAGASPTAPLRELEIVSAACPGATQRTREIVEEALAADVSVLLVDARPASWERARWLALIASSLGVRHLVLAVSTPESAADAEAVFARIEAEFHQLAAKLGLDSLSCVPIAGSNPGVGAERPPALSWYRGPTLLGLLNQLKLEAGSLLDKPLRFVVQATQVRGGELRAFGRVVGGSVQRGDRVRIQPMGRTTRVVSIAVEAGEVERALAGQAVTLVLDGEHEVSAGNLIAAADSSAEVANQFEATVIWFGEAPLLRGRAYPLRIGAATTIATIGSLKHKLDPASLQRVPAAKLEKDELGICNLELSPAVAFDAFSENRTTGGCTLVDPSSGQAVGVGMLSFALRRASNVQWQALDVDRGARASLKGQKPYLLWYTGLSGAGKSTIANLVDRKLHAMGRHSYLLDGDNVRHGLNKDLGFTDADRVENVRRIAEVAKLMVDAGLIVGTAFISPFRAERQMARALLPNEFIEIFVDTPLLVAEGRDPKGLYKKARRGELKNFTGIDSPYEAPENPELRIDTTLASPEQAAELIIELLIERGAFRRLD